MKRRAFVAGMAAIITAPLTAKAQQAGKVHRVGYVVPAPGPIPAGQGFDRGLREAGLIEGKNVIVDRQFMGGREQQYATVLADIEKRVDVIVVAAPPAALAAKKAVTKVPVVFAAVGDPVAIGLVDSLARPGGNLTGVAFDASPDIAAKRLALLKESFPSITRVAALWSSPDPVGVPLLRHVEDAAPRLGVTVRSFDVRTAEDFDGVFREIAGDRLDSLLVIGGPVHVVYRQRIVSFAATHRMPAISISRDYVDAGGLMSYGPNLHEIMRRAATYVARILKGARPGDLPVEQPAAFEFVVSKKTASSLGLTIPPGVLARADQVIE